jgi:hypothetical protein
VNSTERVRVVVDDVDAIVIANAIAIATDPAHTKIPPQ